MIRGLRETCRIMLLQIRVNLGFVLMYLCLKSLRLKRYRYAVYSSSIAVLVVGSLGTA